MHTFSRVASALVAVMSLVCGCKSKPPPPAEPRPDYVKECREGKEGACAKACLEVDPSFCNDEIIKWRSNPSTDEKLYWDLLERSCRNGDSEHCEELGRIIIGRDNRRALTVYERICAGVDAGEAECLETRKKWIAGVEAVRSKCEAGDVNTCVDLGEAYRTADSYDNAIEAFAKVCEFRGFDVEEVFRENPWAGCSNDSRIPHYAHPGPRAACAKEVVFETAIGGARSFFNMHPYTNPLPLQNDAAVPATPDKPVVTSTKMQIGKVGHTKVEYPTEKMTAELEGMSERFVYCASESPELKGKYSFFVTFVLDRVGVPGFVHIHHSPDNLGHVSGEPWRRLITCNTSVLNNHIYPAPPGGKGLRFVTTFTMNPNAQELKPIRAAPL